MSYKRLLLVSLLVCGVVLWADAPQFNAEASGAHSAGKSAGQTLVMFKEKHEEDYYNGKPKVKGVIAQLCFTGTIHLYRCPKGAKQVHVRFGLWIWWWPNGKKMAERRYHLGRLEGISKGWFSNGKLRFIEVYKHGKLDGVRTAFYLTGKIKRKESYSSGLRDGRLVTYWPNGKKASSGQFKKGFRDGVWRTFYVNGDAKEKVQYSKGKRDGLYVLWRSICQPAGCAPIKSLQGHYKNDKKNGAWTRWVYNADGKLQNSVTNWKDGQKTL